MNIDIRRSTEAGVSRSISNPFSSMEINDQVGGVNGGITGTAASASANRAAPRVLFAAGIVRTPFEATASIVGR